MKALSSPCESSSRSMGAPHDCSSAHARAGSESAPGGVPEKEARRTEEGKKEGQGQQKNSTTTYSHGVGIVRSSPLDPQRFEAPSVPGWCSEKGWYRRWLAQGEVCRHRPWPLRRGVRRPLACRRGGAATPPCCRARTGRRSPGNPAAGPVVHGVEVAVDRKRERERERAHGKR